MNNKFIRVLINTFIVATSFLICTQIKAETILYDFTFGGNKVGYLSLEENKINHFNVHFEFNDRGRGPNLDGEIILDEDYYPISYKVEGVDYLKSKTKEVFTLQDGMAKWESRLDSGEKQVDNPGFYSSLTLAYDAFFQPKLMLNQESNQIDIIPDGQASYEMVHRHRVELAGEIKQLQLMAITESDFDRKYIWVDQNNQMFASLSPFIGIILQGWNEFGQELLQIQQSYSDDYVNTKGKSLVHLPKKATVFKNASLFNSLTGKVVSEQTVVVKGKRIVSVGKTGETQLPDEFKVIDVKGKFLMPGMFDMHTHAFRPLTSGINHLAAGVTSIRDMASSEAAIKKLKSSYDNLSFPGPRIVWKSGFIDKAGPFAGPGLTVKTLEEGLQAVRDYADQGYQQIKLYSSIEPQWVKPMAELAHELGMRVSGHIPKGMLAEEAIKAGFDEIQHINMLMLNFMSRELDTRTPVRFSAIGEDGHKVDVVNDRLVKQFIQLLVEEQIIVDLTLTAFEELLTDKAGVLGEKYFPYIDKLSESFFRGYKNPGIPIAEGKEDDYQLSYQTFFLWTKALYDAGVPLVAGTDAIEGIAYTRELELYAKAGIPNKSILQIATINAARIVGREKDLGSISQGKLADLVIIDGDPTKDINQIRNVELTMKDGAIFYADELWKSLVSQ